jgi:hypothetical protein
MALCVLVNDCPFFQNMLEGMPSISELLKEEYCRGDHGQCARFIVFQSLGRESVPRTLFPQHRDIALRLVTGR